MNILEKFEARFGTNSESRVKFLSKHTAKSNNGAEYAKALLLGQPSNAIVLSIEERMAAEKWYMDCRILIDKVEELARRGVDRGGFEFDVLKQRAKKLASVYFEGSEKCLAITRMLRAYDEMITNRRNKRDQAVKTASKYEDDAAVMLFSNRKKTIKPGMVAAHPNSILGLRPAKKWIIVADETGSSFNPCSKKSNEKTGRYVFVLIPDYATLPELPTGWHAFYMSKKARLSVAERLYHSGCGIIGVSVDDLYRTNGELWYACIEALMDMTLRLIPVDGETEIELKVEQRGANDASRSELLDKTMDDVMYHLSLVNPEKAEQIKLSAQFIAKTESPFNGYADLVAYSWGCGLHMRPLFEKFGWVGPCLIAEDPTTAKTFHRCLDLVRNEGVLTAADWNVLVTCKEYTAVGSLMGALLRAYGKEARAELDKWRIYLDYVVRHLDSKSIQMRVLIPQIKWLKEYEPAEAELPPRIRLLWLTAQLASKNHEGGVSFGTHEYAAEFTELCEKLREEDAPLVCFAALNLAVEKTDRYEFAQARDMLLPWKDVDPAIPGSRYYAQVLSSLGQHEAFLGNNESALILFKEAMARFSKLSDNWQRDYDQTCAYAVIAAIDSDALERDALMAIYLYGGEYSTKTMIDMAQQFATVGGDEPDSKYAHAILLRYLVTLPSDNLIRRAYLDKVVEWKWSDDGHPWELIAFYRAILLAQQGNDSFGDWLQRGYDLCKNSSLTMQVISCVILGALLYFKKVTDKDYTAWVERVIPGVPALGEERIAVLRSQARIAMPPLQLAQKVLPFNFR